MANSTGKAARKRYGNRYDCKRSKTKRRKNKQFGLLPISCIRKNAPWM